MFLKFIMLFSLDLVSWKHITLFKSLCIVVWRLQGANKVVFLFQASIWFKEQGKVLCSLLGRTIGCSFKWHKGTYGIKVIFLIYKKGLHQAKIYVGKTIILEAKKLWWISPLFCEDVSLSTIFWYCSDLISTISSSLSLITWIVVLGICLFS